ncbi:MULTISPECIES: AEC family transporter [unclassified Coleofasciculus]|uniref:AEC family transporter n=1 Tax=unclassified Coleofasciculus TaxID=2692782 RepID=UPI0018821EF2|nr:MULTISPECIES: AEC family transporter [unclassified Coleofasciculus]MBE9128826.1 AEC family transporter [Coleofasciculus sp. LEGE 07081]MBE9151536.1 AEC family transporter [Coleofasciculus sp. LEGE 07092]
MTETLFYAYTPLFIWVGLGLLLFRFVPERLPRLLGRALYWVGVPLEILALARRTEYSEGMGLALAVTVAALTVGLAIAWIGWLLLNRWFESKFLNEAKEKLQERSRQGSFILSAMLGNTGFIGLAIAPLLVSDEALGLVVVYSITQNIVGTYGVGVFIASYFGGSRKSDRFWVQIRDVFFVPSLWAFIIGSFTRSVVLPAPIESGLQASIWVVIPTAFLLMGIRLGQIQGWQSFQIALVPAFVKVVALPGLVGIGTTLLGLPAASRLALVLMSGMPTAFAGLILAEEYELDRELIASSIVVTSVMLLLIIPLWLVLFGEL